MTKINLVQVLLVLLFLLPFISCAPKKNITKGNHLFRYINNQEKRVKNPDIQDEYHVYEVKESFKSAITDKTDYLIIKDDKTIKASKPTKTISVKPNPTKIALNDVIYTSENSGDDFDDYQESFKYTDVKVALQTLSIPFKFRGKIDDGSVIPNQIETGINVGFAPVVKFNLNYFNPHKKYMGKATNQYSINSGLLLNLGSTDLKAASSAPGITVDRKAATFSYGTFVMLGVNNINFGYAIGWDNAIGDGSSNWVYQNKLWHGLIIALDIIKP